MDILRQLAKAMDEEYEGIVRRQNERVPKAKKRDRQTHQIDGRLDILARWAARLRVEADRSIVRQFQKDYQGAAALGVAGPSTAKALEQARKLATSSFESDLGSENRILKKALVELEKSINPNGPAARGCPQCASCGRDGSEGAVMREVFLRLLREAESARDAATRKLEELLEDRAPDA